MTFNLLKTAGGAHQLVIETSRTIAMLFVSATISPFGAAEIG